MPRHAASEPVKAVAARVSSLEDLKARVADLEARLAALEATVSRLPAGTVKK